MLKIISDPRFGISTIGLVWEHVPLFLHNCSRIAIQHWEMCKNKLYLRFGLSAIDLGWSQFVKVTQAPSFLLFSYYFFLILEIFLPCLKNSFVVTGSARYPTTQEGTRRQMLVVMLFIDAQ